MTTPAQHRARLEELAEAWKGDSDGAAMRWALAEVDRLSRNEPERDRIQELNDAVVNLAAAMHEWFGSGSVDIRTTLTKLREAVAHLPGAEKLRGGR